MKVVFLIYLVVVTALIASQGFAQEASSQADPSALIGDPYSSPKSLGDKSDYWLLSPVPEDQMRPFSTDRPGKTHSSTTVDAGHFQIESDFVDYTFDRHSPSEQTTEAYSLATPILKFGLTNNIDIEGAFALFNRNHVTDRPTGITSTGEGFGDFSLGSKINLFGNDGGRQSLALLPFIKFPTAAPGVGNGVTEYTLNAPYTIDLDNLWSVTAEPALGFLKNADDNGLHSDYSFIVNLNRPVFTKSVTAAVEIASDYSSDHNIGPRYTLDPSLQWLVTKTLQLDVGIYLGLNKAAADYNPYTGISYRY